MAPDLSANGPRLSPASPDECDGGWQVRIEPSGLHFVAPAGQSLLDAARAGGIDLPRSCRNGTCRACLCQLQSGHAHHRIAWPGLSQDEKQAGWILPCVAQADSDLVLWQAQARARPPEPEGD